MALQFYTSKLHTKTQVEWLITLMFYSKFTCFLHMDCAVFFAF